MGTNQRVLKVKAFEVHDSGGDDALAQLEELAESRYHYRSKSEAKAAEELTISKVYLELPYLRGREDLEVLLLGGLRIELLLTEEPALPGRGG